MKNMPTIKQLLREAEQIEMQAAESLPAYIICGEIFKYEAKMLEARNMRHAATLPRRDRAEYMRNVGLS